MMVVYKCDLCNELKECLPKEIDGRVYDICIDCWRPLEKKLKGKGRPAKASEAVFLSPPRREPRKEKEEPFPGQPPDINFWEMYDKAIRRADREGWTPLKEV